MESNGQICFDCENARGKCSWSKDFIPIPGWKAEPTRVLMAEVTTKAGKKKKYYTDSFSIKECPKFEPLKINNDREFLKLLARNIERLGDVNDR